MVNDFSKMFIFSFLGQYFCKHFYFITGFYKKKNFADSKSRVQELSNDVFFVIFRLQTWGLEGGKMDPPANISWFLSSPAGIRLRQKMFS